MKKFIETLKNIWSIEDLRKRILFTLALILVYRVGCYITLPGINPVILDAKSGGGPDGLLGLFNAFAGGAFSRASIFALGVMPYISASIFMQLAGIVVPQVAKLQKEESGRRTVNQYTRYLTVVVTIFQASAYVAYLRGPEFAQALIPEYSSFLFWFTTVVVLTAGTLFVMWLGEKITDKGIGNGISILIMVGILARLPESIIQEFTAKNSGGGGGLLIFLVEIAVFIAVIVGLILLTQGVRKIPLNYARRIIGSTNAAKEVAGGARDFIPLKVNSSGVMPIIFAQAILFIPGTIVGFTKMTTEGATGGFMRSLSDPTSFWHNFIYAVLVIAFTYFYTALIFNPTEMADNLKRNNSFIPGIKPGEPTANFIATIMDRITLPGAVFLAVAGILPGIAGLLGVTSGFATFFGGTSMLIGVGVILDTLQQIESHLLMRHYDGMMKSGRIMGRTTAAPVAE
ncbi:MAG: preprotein translocase subunit SecY [Chitinophagaceae bacterium]|nr:preprotein translocase subunit SecY [Chitinophagaceae bacterium]